MNNLYEFGGIADVLIKIKYARNIGGIEYVENEPYTILKDVSIVMNYEQILSNASAKKPIISNQSSRPYQITIDNIPLTEKVCNLIATKTDIHNYTKTKNVKAMSSDGKNIFLPSEPLDKNIFIYDQNLNKIQYDGIENGTIIGKFFVNQEYLIFYDEELYGDVYNFDVPTFAYFCIEINGKGNKDKNTNTNFMKFDSVSLVSIPVFNMTSQNLLNSPLIFNIIYEKQKDPILVFNK